MERFSPSVTKLIASLAKLPGIGNKTAQRLAFHLLGRSKEEARTLAEAIITATEGIRLCSLCCNLTEGDPCDICTDETRDLTTVCVVESPRDVAVFERMREYRGLYHVLHGVISPMSQTGPEQIKLRELVTRLRNHPEITEVIVATNPNIEGEATALYIARLLKPANIKVTRLAHGIPMGSELEYTDDVTLAKAIEGRQELL